MRHRGEYKNLNRRKQKETKEELKILYFFKILDTN